jgi:formiminoglutamase
LKKTLFFYGKAVAFTMNDLAKTNHRSGEIKFGEKMLPYQRSRCYNLLQNSEAKYVLVGIPEDIGVEQFGKTWCRFSMGHSN